MNNQNKYSTKELLILGLLLVAAVASVLFYWNYRTLAFPEHSIDLDITRREAEEKARDTAQAFGLDTTDYRSATIFEIREEEKTFLEREVGAMETGELAEDDVVLWHFTTRFFRPLEREEFSFSFLPNGRLAAFLHEIEEEAEGADLSEEEAQNAAEAFLSQYTGIDLSDWNMIASEKTERPHRSDHSFMWEQEAFEHFGATYRLRIVVQGDAVGEYREFLHVPEAWERQYASERSQNMLAQSVGNVATFVVLGIGMLAMLVILIRKRVLRWKFALWAGSATAAVVVLTYLNLLPLITFFYDTLMSWPAFLGNVIFGMTIDVFMEGLPVLLSAAVGWALWRKMSPGAIAVPRQFTSALATKPVNKAIIIGGTSALILLAYNLAYYFAGQQVGFWIPADVDYGDILSTVAPWTLALFIGFTAAASEEGLFRLFGVSFLKKLSGRTWIAVIVTSVVFALVHSMYPVSPWYARGIEIIPIGILLAWLFLRYGIISAFVSHYTANAMLTALAFLSMAGWGYASASSLVLALAPLVLAVAWGGYAQITGRFRPVKEEWRNASERDVTQRSMTRPREVQQVISEQSFLNTNMRIVLILLAILVGIAGWVASREVSVEPSVSITRREARELAKEALREAVNPDEFRSAVLYFSSPKYPLEARYVLEHGGINALRSFFPDYLTADVWSIRFFRLLEEEEYTVVLRADGAVSRIIHELGEDAVGQHLSSEEAEGMARAAAAETSDVHGDDVRLVESSTERMPNRTDHKFVFEVPGRGIAEAPLRVSADVLGDRVSAVEQFLHLPELWERERKKTTTLDFAAYAVFGLGVLALLVAGIRQLWTAVRNGAIPWKKNLLIASGMAVLSMIGILNHLDSLVFALYQTEIPFVMFVLIMAMSLIFMLAGMFLLSIIAVSLGRLLWERFFGPIRLKIQAVQCGDAVLSGYAVPVIIAGVSAGWTFLALRMGWARGYEFGVLGSDISSIIPGLSTITMLTADIIIMLFAVSAVLLLRTHLKRWMFVAIAVAFAVLVFEVIGQRTVEEFVVSLAGTGVLLVTVGLLVKYILRSNAWAYIAAVYVTVLGRGAFALLTGTESTALRLHGVMLVVLLLVPLAWLVWNKKITFNKK